MVKFIFSFLFLVFAFLSSKATVYGCVPNSNTVVNYTTLVSGTTFSKTGTIVNLGPGCAWIWRIPSTACTVNGTGTGSGAGFQGVDTPQFCPIDDYVWLIMIIFGGLGYVYVRQKKHHLSFSSH